METKVIAFANHKGGVGKTTSVASVGAMLADRGKKTLLIDLDAQSNLTASLYKGEAEATIYNSFKEGAALPILPLRKNLALSPSSLDMAGVELDIANRLSREFLLKEMLEPLMGKYDYILLDCPPSLSLITINAFVAATDIYIPLTAEALPSKGLKMLTDIIAMVQKRLNPSLSLSGIIITKYKKTKLSQMVEEQLRASFGAAVFKTKIRENIAVAEAPLFAQDIATYSPKSNGAQDYAELTKEIVRRK